MRTRTNTRQTTRPAHCTVQCPDAQELTLRPHLAILAVLHNILDGAGQAIQAAHPVLFPGLDRCPAALGPSTQHSALAILHLAAILRSAIEQHFEATYREHGQLDLITEDIPF